MDRESVEGLSAILEQIDYKFEFLIGVVYQSENKGCDSHSWRSHVLRTPEEIQDYLSRQVCDIIIMTWPEHVPVVFDRLGQGWVKRTGNTMEWVKDQLKTELIIIALS